MGPPWRPQTRKIRLEDFLAANCQAQAVTYTINPLCESAIGRCRGLDLNPRHGTPDAVFTPQYKDGTFMAVVDSKDASRRGSSSHKY